MGTWKIRFWASLSLALAMMSTGRWAAADDETTTTKQWYRESLAAAYAVPVGGGAMVLGGLQTGSAGLALAGVAPWALGGIVPSIVHWTHGNTGRGFLSMGGQSLGTTFGVVIAMSAMHCESRDASENCFTKAIVLGSTLGTAAWGAIDISEFAYEEKPAHVSVIPTVTPVDRGAILGVAGELP